MKEPTKIESMNEFMSLQNLPDKPIKEAIALQLQTEKYLKALEEAIKTLRKTECYGANSSPFDFEWPKPADLLRMAKNI